MNTERKGNFIISLDFELMWGIRDKKTVNEYGANISGVWDVMPKLLTLFDKYSIRATFATVGLLFFKNKGELISNIPSKTPSYTDNNLSPYEGYIDNLNETKDSDIYHFAPELINLIKKYEHEIASHTFSHYYCREEGQNSKEFEEDLSAYLNITNSRGIEIKSIVFPRNQINKKHLEILSKYGITSYRGTEKSWIYNSKNTGLLNMIQRLCRLADNYINISGTNCHNIIKDGDVINIPSSRFLRPFNKRLACLDFLKKRRIKKAMLYAAKNKLTFHLWWHPHNFGINQEKNLSFLEDILGYYQFLNKKYNFTNYTMVELANRSK